MGLLNLQLYFGHFLRPINLDTEPIVPLDHERSSLLARSSPLGSDITSEDSIMMSTTQERKLGSQLLKSTKFWQLFMLMGILGGIALMTIK